MARLVSFLGGAFIVGIALAIGLALPAAAQRNILPLDARNVVFNEHFDENPKVSGTVHALVGVQWLGPRGNFDPAGIAVRLPPQLRGAKACVAITSKDGRYHAQNLYDIPPDAPADPRLAAGTAKPQLSSRYGNDLVAVSIRVVKDCDSPDVGVLLPAVLGTSSPSMPPQIDPSRRMVALLHGEPNQLAVRVIAGGQEISQFNGCTTKSTDVRIAFTSSCVLTVPASVAPGRYDLEVTYRGRFDKSQTIYPIIVN